jgi:isochorismate hydrolase
MATGRPARATATASDRPIPLAAPVMKTLRSNDIRTVVMTGCTTDGGVESTARDAMFNDHYVVIAQDCLGSDDPAQHEASMFLMQHRFDLATGAELSRIWAEGLAADADRAPRMAAS